MTVSALTRPGERDRLIVKLSEIDWVFVLVLSLIAGAGALMLFSIAGSSWQPWAASRLASSPCPQARSSTLMPGRNSSNRQASSATASPGTPAPGTAGPCTANSLPPPGAAKKYR